MALKIDYSMRLPEGEYLPPVGKKSGISIHHTAGGTTAPTFDHWLNDRTESGERRIVGTAYLVDRDGTVFQLFGPTAWAFQFGLSWPDDLRWKFEQRFIGIELASEGALKEFDGKLYCFDRISPKTQKPRSEAYDHGSSYRGYRYFDRYEPVQIDGLVALVNYLCDTYSIPRQVPFPPVDYYGERLVDFKGVIGHAMVRKAKSDPTPNPDFLDRLVEECKLTPVNLVTERRSPNGRPVERELEELQQTNVKQVKTLAVAAGSMVKGLLMELRRRDTYIKLFGAREEGHSGQYSVVHGRPALVKRLAKAFGFERATDSSLVVAHG